MTPVQLKELETEIMAHRYLYYVLADPVVHDIVYDGRENLARAILPKDSPVHNIGSSLAHNYKQEWIDAAMELLSAP